MEANLVEKSTTIPTSGISYYDKNGKIVHAFCPFNMTMEEWLETPEMKMATDHNRRPISENKSSSFGETREFADWFKEEILDLSIDHKSFKKITKKYNLTLSVWAEGRCWFDMSQIRSAYNEMSSNPLRPDTSNTTVIE